jgi:hypothetical protein
LPNFRRQFGDTLFVQVKLFPVFAPGLLDDGEQFFAGHRFLFIFGHGASLLATHYCIILL